MDVEGVRRVWTTHLVREPVVSEKSGSMRRGTEVGLGTSRLEPSLGGRLELYDERLESARAAKTRAGSYTGSSRLGVLLYGTQGHRHDVEVNRNLGEKT